MPEKVRTKFGDVLSSAASNLTKDLPSTSIESTPNGERDLNRPTSSHLNNSVKRLRDGSPKKRSDSSNDHSWKKKHENSKKGQANGGSLGSRERYGKLPAEGVNGAAILHHKSSAHQSTQKSKFNSQRDANKKSSRQPRQLLSRATAEIQKSRQGLPIWAKKGSIKQALRSNNVLLLNGETGSGKSTQVPQFLCREPWCKKTRVKVKSKDGKEEEILIGGLIAITQPRRVAATSLARRVATEMGSHLEANGAAGSVGYAVRFESVTPPGMKIKFLTEGILLQEMLHDPNLRRYSAVIVDEIHERSVDVDLITGFLRKLVHSDFKGRGGVPLKVIVMSATLDLGGIEAFFAKPGTRPQYKPGTNHGNVFAPHLLGDDVDSDLDSHLDSYSTQDSLLPPVGSESSWSGLSGSEDEASKNTTRKLSRKGIPTVKNGKPESKKTDPTRKLLADRTIKEDFPGDHDFPMQETGVAFVFVQGRQFEVESIFQAKPVDDYLQEMMKIILHIHVTEPLPGDILAFLTGQDEIETLQVQLEQYAEKLAKGMPRMKILPLYGSLSAPAQQLVFEKVKGAFTRKIVLATNIAETSVTVSGVRFVVDCGKSKVKQYRPRLGMESLLVKPISIVSAIQRCGRAGREAKGKCFRIYTEEAYEKFDEDERPEILRSDVIEAVLKMKARGVDDVLTFPLMDSPNLVAMEKALLQLHMIGALDNEGKITDTGFKMASYPLPASYGRVLIAAAEPEADVLLEAIDVISCFTSDAEVFLQPKSEEESQIQQDLRNEIAKRHGDIVTTLNAMQQYACVTTDRQKWCKDRLISFRAMRMALQIRRQLRQTCVKQKLLKELPPQDPQPFEQITPERAEALLKVFLKAFVMKTAVLGPDGSYMTTQGRNTIAIHPGSVLHGKKVEAIMFLEHVFTAKSYAKKVSAIQANWIEEVLLG